MHPLPLLVATAITIPVPARGERCAELARPKVFDASSAMRAVFCEYDVAHGGALIPTGLTRGWRIEEATLLASPLLAATYREGGERKGVLVLQRQQLQSGKPAGGHPSPAEVSVYVFREQNGAFVFEKGAREATTAGANGTAPAPRLIHLGPERFGLWFEWGDSYQGETVDTALILSLSDSRILTLAGLTTERSNSGCCGVSCGKCWGFECSPELLPADEEPWDLLRLRCHGTDEVKDGVITSRDGSMCYARQGNRLVKVSSERCVGRAARPEADVFGAADQQDRRSTDWLEPNRVRK